MRLRITGNSHVACLKHGLKTMPLFGDWDIRISGFIWGRNQRKPFARRDGKAVEFTPTYSWEKFLTGIDMERPRIEGTDTVWGICLLPHSEFLYCDREWVERNRSRLECGIREDMASPLGFMCMLKNAGIPSFAIPTPGPRHDNGEIPHGVSHTTVAQIDHVYRKIMTEAFEETQIDLLPLPVGTHDENGFLRPEYSHAPPDPDHANAAYGALMMRDIIDHVREKYD